MSNWHIAQNCTGHRRTVLAADLCGCFFCFRTFAPTDIVEWVDFDEQGVGQTALCPNCGVDAVIPSVPGSPVTDELLVRLHRRGFGEPSDGPLPKWDAQ